MYTKEEVEVLLNQMIEEGLKKPEIIVKLAEACLGWPYVFGAWGEWCTPANRGRRMRSDHPTIQTKCRVLNNGQQWRNKSDNTYCDTCRWACGVRMFDCRGFTAWLLRSIGLDLVGEGCSSQYNTASNWVQRGEISDMPNVVCCVFMRQDGKMEHTGLHIGNGNIIHCSTNVQTGDTSNKKWTHYAIPVGLYDDVPVVIHPTLRKGSTGDDVKKLQELLNNSGYHCGTADGIFGVKTESAVKAFQKNHGLTVDGICGKKTWAAIDPEPQKEEEKKETEFNKILCGIKDLRAYCIENKMNIPENYHSMLLKAINLLESNKELLEAQCE